MDSKRHGGEAGTSKGHDIRAHSDTFVLDRGIFSNIFEKDIRRVYIYKKAERLAKAIHLVSPAFRTAPALRDRMDQVAVGLVDAAILPPGAARDGMSRELLALSSVLSIARTGGLLSAMNAELIAGEAHQLLQEIATYEEPRLFFDDAPTLAALAKEAAREGATSFSTSISSTSLSEPKRPVPRPASLVASQRPQRASDKGQYKRQNEGSIKDTSRDERNAERRKAIVSILGSKGPSYIKDISTLIREVSEKTIQRDLQALIDAGEVAKEGERRWTVYSLAR